MNITYLSTLNACLILILSMRTINAEQTFYCQPASGETYETLIEIHRLEKSPAWDSHSENPPLSARKALAIAEDFLRNEVLPNCIVPDEGVQTLMSSGAMVSR